MSSPARVTTNAGDPGPGEGEALNGSRHGAREDSDDEGQPLRHAVVHVQNGEDGRREGADRADREIELTEQQHEDETDRDQTRAHDVHAEIGQVPG